MARLIDADMVAHILAEMASEPDYQHIWEDWRSGLHMAMEAVNEASIVDAVEVVRCKDCKHWNEETEWCNNHSHFIGAKGEACHPWESNDWKMFDADYFCKDGERKEVNEK